jgi:hypothetical protein
MPHTTHSAAIEDVHSKNGDVYEHRAWPTACQAMAGTYYAAYDAKNLLVTAARPPVLRWSGGVASFVAEQSRIGYYVRQTLYWLNQLRLLRGFLQLQVGSHDVGNSPEAITKRKVNGQRRFATAG